MKVEISGVGVEQRERWDAARGHESLASWARRMLDAAAALPSVVAATDTGSPGAALEGAGGHGARGEPATAGLVSAHETPSVPSSAEHQSVGESLAGEVVAAGALTERGSRGDAEGAVSADPPGSDRAELPEAAPAIVPSRSVSAEQEATMDRVPAKEKLGSKPEFAGLLPKKKRARTKVCEHRLPVESFCWRCDQ